MNELVSVPVHSS